MDMVGGRRERKTKDKKDRKEGGTDGGRNGGKNAYQGHKAGPQCPPRGHLEKGNGAYGRSGGELMGSFHKERCCEDWAGRMSQVRAISSKKTTLDYEENYINMQQMF